MILNGITKEKFLEWISLNNLFTIEDREKYFNSLYELSQNALIIEFFDSAGIYIDAEFFRKNIKDEPQFVSSTTDEWNGLQPLRVQYNSRQEAIIQAIKKANDIYNERFK